MGGFTSDESTTNLATKEFPGLFGTPEGAAIGETLRALIGTGQPNQRLASSPYTNLLYQELTRPNFAPTNEAESTLFNDIVAQTQGATALRGLGPATPGALAQTLAPTMLGLEQQRIGNLQNALGADLSGQISQRGQDITQIGQNMKGLLDLAGLTMPQQVAGQAGESKGGGVKIMYGGQ